MDGLSVFLMWCELEKHIEKARELAIKDANVGEFYDEAKQYCELHGIDMMRFINMIAIESILEYDKSKDKKMNRYEAEFQWLKQKAAAEKKLKEERNATLQGIIDRMNGRDGCKPTKMEF